MPLKDFEKQILRLLASNRNPDSFVAGATVLLRAADTHRRSEDIDLFHDTEESVAVAVLRDTATLESNQYRVELGPPQPTFRRAQVSQADHATKVEWVFDSAFRFFPVQADPELGYVLNFWDAATNKVLALAGRSEVRDYLDVLHLHQKHLSLAALVWAACGKDAGFTPQFLLEEAQRNVRFSRSQLAHLDLAVPVDLVA